METGLDAPHLISYSSSASHANCSTHVQLQDASGVAAVWAPEVVRDQLQAFRSSDDLLSFFTELKELLHVRNAFIAQDAMPASLWLRLLR